MSLRTSTTTPSESQRRRDSQADFVRSAVILITSIMHALTSRNSGDTSSDEEFESGQCALDEEGPCTSTGPGDPNFDRRECYITEEARRNEIRMQEQFILRSTPSHCHRFLQGESLETVSVVIPRPRYSPVSFAYPGVRKRKFDDCDGPEDGCAKMHHPGLAFSCDPDRMHLNDSAAAYDEYEHRLQSRHAYAAGGDPDACCSTFIHFAPAAVVPPDEPREFSAPRQFDLYRPTHYALRRQPDANDVHGQN